MREKGEKNERLTDLNQIWYGRPILSLYLKFPTVMSVKSLSRAKSYRVF
jgi:hypothetical protein